MLIEIFFLIADLLNFLVHGHNITNYLPFISAFKLDKQHPMVALYFMD